MRKPNVHERYVLVEVTPPSVKSMPLGLFNGPLAQCPKVYPIAPCQLIYIFIIKYFADYHVALYWRSSNFRLEKSSLNLKSEQTLNAPCTLCETLLARSEILYFLVFSQTELAPSPNKSCQYKVSATQYLPISSPSGGYWVHYLLQLFLLSFNGNLHAKGKSWSLLSLETSFLFFARKLCSI